MTKKLQSHLSCVSNNTEQRQAATRRIPVLTTTDLADMRSFTQRLLQQDFSHWHATGQQIAHNCFAFVLDCHKILFPYAINCMVYVEPRGDCNLSDLLVFDHQRKKAVIAQQRADGQLVSRHAEHTIEPEQSTILGAIKGVFYKNIGLEECIA